MIKCLKKFKKKKNCHHEYTGKSNLRHLKHTTHLNEKSTLTSGTFSFTWFVQMVYPSQVPIPAAYLQLPAFEPSPCPIPTLPPDKNTLQMNINTPTRNR